MQNADAFQTAWFEERLDTTDLRLKSPPGFHLAGILFFLL
jgi:hypothetical protein